MSAEKKEPVINILERLPEIEKQLVNCTRFGGVQERVELDDGKVIIFHYRASAEQIYCWQRMKVKRIWQAVRLPRRRGEGNQIVHVKLTPYNGEVLSPYIFCQIDEAGELVFLPQKSNKSHCGQISRRGEKPRCHRRPPPAIAIAVTR